MTTFWRNWVLGITLNKADEREKKRGSDHRESVRKEFKRCVMRDAREILCAKGKKEKRIKHPTD